MADLLNLARMKTATTGTGTATLSTAVSGFLTFALAGAVNGRSYSYAIMDGINSEVGIGVYSSTGPTITRVPTASTNGNAAINLSGTAEIAISPRKEDLAFPTTGDGQITLKSVAPAGWRMMDDGTIGSATSGASYANAETFDLFNLLFASPFDDIAAPLFTSAGAATTRAAQTNAATAWAANCRMSLTKQLGRSIAIAGAGATLTARALGRADGSETHTQTPGELAIHEHGSDLMEFLLGDGQTLLVDGTTGSFSLFWPKQKSPTTANAGSNTPMDIMNPRSYWNVMIKL